ncbi:hypothetical protein AB0B45_08840 [Nonomuraea sp. NPDC049152]|uniref:hypothetical protein n=1 Tax=Nonomuraea sp. NPDC049152 TaxID=3154350 RepID=UPI0033E09BE3
MELDDWEEVVCVSRHVADLVDAYVPIDWAAEAPRADRVRVKSFTCDCMPVFYELCQAAGLMFIRRLSRGGDVTVVHESPWLRSALVEELWEELLRGEAR